MTPSVQRSQNSNEVTTSQPFGTIARCCRRTLTWWKPRSIWAPRSPTWASLTSSALPTLSFKNPVILNLGLAYYKKGDFANAREQFETLHKLQPKDVRVAILLGDADLRLQKAAEAVALMEPLASANADNLDFEYVYGSALIAAGRRRDGAPHVEKVAQTGNSADAYLLAGATLLQLNDFEPARKDLEAALRLNPKLPNIYTLVGTVRDKTGDVKEAEPAFREALKVNPDDFDANLYLGAILYKHRDMDEAKIYLDRALKLNPTNSLARYEAAMLKSAAGEYAAAAQELEKLVKDDPQWLDPHVQLATLYYKLHRPEDGARERQVVERLTAEQQSRGPGQ
jgi:tetratricopeptide (TPR) repeat protein